VIERAPTLSDEQLRALVRHGKDRMPPYSPNVISDAQLTELVAYMRALK
jgi:mono/diheme cytochrome c family protein